jgi:hypothetical protein
VFAISTPFQELPHFAQTQLLLLVLATNTYLDQGLQRLLAIGHEQLWLLAQAAKVHASPMRVRQ